MDTKMEIDVGKIPESANLSASSEPASIPTLDGWIDNLLNCKQLAESDIQRLCDKVRYSEHQFDSVCGLVADIVKRLGKSFKMNRMFNQ